MKTPILAVFGNTLHFVSATNERSRQIPDGADVTTSLLQLVAESGEQPKRVSLVYHPADLQDGPMGSCFTFYLSRPLKPFAGLARLEGLKESCFGVWGKLEFPRQCWLGVTSPGLHLPAHFIPVSHRQISASHRFVTTIRAFIAAATASIQAADLPSLSMCAACFPTRFQQLRQFVPPRRSLMPATTSSPPVKPVDASVPTRESGCTPDPHGDSQSGNRLNGNPKTYS